MRSIENRIGCSIFVNYFKIINTSKVFFSGLFFLVKVQINTFYSVDIRKIITRRMEGAFLSDILKNRNNLS